MDIKSKINWNNILPELLKDAYPQKIEKWLSDNEVDISGDNPFTEEKDGWGKVSMFDYYKEYYQLQFKTKEEQTEILARSRRHLERASNEGLAHIGEYKDELTTEMHSEFTVSNETDLKHKVWAAISQSEKGGQNIEDLFRSFGIDKTIYQTYKDTYPR